MSRIKNAIENAVEKLAKQTGYAWDYLMDRLNEVFEEDGMTYDAWDYFVGVTLELDW